MLREEGITDGATRSQRLIDLQEKKKEDISRELRRSASEEARSYVQEEITAEEVEEWIPSAAAVDLEWLFRSHGYDGPERTYKYYQLFSVK